MASIPKKLQKAIAQAAAKALAEKVIDSAYGYQMGAVLFKPTLTTNPQTFRTTRAGALAYFVGGDPSFPKDTGFALKGWRKVDVNNAAIFIAGDVMEQADLEGFIDQTIAHFGTLDILVNNAGGAGDLQPLVNLSDHAFDEAMKWNVYSTFWATRRALPTMLDKGDGRIINISSMEGKHGKPVLTAYSAAKHAVNGMTKSLAREVGAQGVTVNAICPGLVITDIIKNNGPATAKAMGMELEEMIALFASEAAIKRPNEVEEIAAAVAKGNSSLAGGWNKALAEVMADGSYAALSKKYFIEVVRCQ